MYRCDICGYSADEELPLCPQCGCEEAEAENSSATELEESDEQRISEDDEQEYTDMVEPFGTMPSSLPRLGLSFKLDKDLE